MPSRVTVNGVDVDSANWSVSTIDSATSLLTVTGVSFSEKTFVVYFIPAGNSGAGDSSGGGGGGSSASIVVEVPTGTTSAPFGLSVSVPPFSVQPGESQTQMITIRWEGATKIVVSKIEFDSHQGIFKVGKSLPYAAIFGEDSLSTQVPLTVTLPENDQGVVKTVQMRVSATANGVSALQVVPVVVNLVPTNDLAVYIGIGLVVLIVGGVTMRKLRRR